MGGDLLGRLQSYIEQLDSRHHPRHHTAALGFDGIHGASGQDHFHGLGLPRQACQTLGTTGTGQHAKLHFRQTETRVVSGDDEVAHQRQFEATA
ncbi:hypothetical protein D3C78_1272560 [compost metagenome]